MIRNHVSLNNDLSGMLTMMYTFVSADTILCICWKNHVSSFTSYYVNQRTSIELKLTQPQNSKNRLNNVGIRGMLCETIASRTTAQPLRRMFAHNLNGVWWILAQPAGNCYCTAERGRREGGGREGAVAVAVRPIGVGRGQTLNVYWVIYKPVFLSWLLSLGRVGEKSMNWVRNWPIHLNQFTELSKRSPIVNFNS